MDPNAKTKIKNRRNCLLERKNDCLERMSTAARRIYLDDVSPARRRVNDDFFRSCGYDRQPFSIEKFIADPMYLGRILQGRIYTAILDDLIEIFDGNYVEICLGGAIGIGKSWEIAIGMAYEMYRLSCLRNPAETLGLIPGSSLAFLNVSVDRRQARKVLFNDLFHLVHNSPYFKRVCPYRKNLRSEIFSPSKNIICYPVASTEQAILGEGVFSGAFDETNFMPIVDKSKRTVPGETGMYDQAEVITNKLRARIRSRFNDRGKIPGHLWFASSARFPNDFTERKEAEAKKDPTIFVRHRALWDAKPRHFFMEQTFKVEVGDITRRTRVLNGTERDVTGTVIEVPMDFHKDFLKDPDKNVRDLAGYSVLLITPFIPRREMIHQMFELGKAAGLRHPFSQVDEQGRPLDVTLQGIAAETERIVPEFLHYVRRQRLDSIGRKMWKDGRHTIPDEEEILFPGLYYAHVDLAKGQRDKCGLVVSHVIATRAVERLDKNAKPVRERMPVHRVDLVLRIVAPPNGKVDFPSIRAIFHQLRDVGMQFGKITYDQYQSQESIKALNDAGFTAELFSVDDENATAYEELKQALYDERLLCYECPLLSQELAQLERTPQKVDHAIRGSKDLADCLAAAVHHAEQGWRSAAGSLGLFQLGEAEQPEQPSPQRQTTSQRAYAKVIDGQPLTAEEEDAIIFGDLGDYR